ncbi:hypothetical protein ACT7C6_33055 [Bacillus paranthracis]
MSPEQVEAFEFVSKQEKQFVADYAQVAFLQRGLLQQERQLQRTERALKAEKSLLQEVVATQKRTSKRNCEIWIHCRELSARNERPFCFVII